MILILSVGAAGIELAALVFLFIGLCRIPSSGLRTGV